MSSAEVHLSWEASVGGSRPSVGPAATKSLLLGRHAAGLDAPAAPLRTPQVKRLGVNEYGTPVSIHTCSACGDEFTVCPPAGPDFGDGCLAPLCPSYDIERDVDYLLAAGQRIVREDQT